MLTNARVLVIEDQFLIAMEIESVLLGAGVREVEIVRSVDDAARREGGWSEFDLAIVEARLGNPAVVAFCLALAASGVAVLVSTADRTAPEVFPGFVILEKPFFSEALLDAYRAAKGGLPGAIPLS